MASIHKQRLMTTTSKQRLSQIRPAPWHMLRLDEFGLHCIISRLINNSHCEEFILISTHKYRGIKQKIGSAYIFYSYKGKVNV